MSIFSHIEDEEKNQTPWPQPRGSGHRWSVTALRPVTNPRNAKFCTECGEPMVKHSTHCTKCGSGRGCLYQGHKRHEGHLYCNGSMQGGATCGTEILPHHDFCGSCGGMVTERYVFCVCGALVEKDDKFCCGCGQKSPKKPPTRSGHLEPFTVVAIRPLKEGVASSFCKHCGRAFVGNATRCSKCNTTRTMICVKEAPGDELRCGGLSTTKPETTCNTVINDQEAFCTTCGGEVRYRPKFCTCDTVLDANDKFCGGCGKPRGK